MQYACRLDRNQRLPVTLATDLSYAVTHLTMRRDKIILAAGSGFLYFYKGKIFIITAWHNITGRHSETLAIMHKQGAVPNNMLVTMPQKIKDGNGFGYSKMPICINLEDENRTYYNIHRQSWPRIDVAIIEIHIENDYHYEIALSDNSIREYDGLLFSKGPDGSFSTLPFIYDGIITGIGTRTSTPNPIHSVGDDLFLLGFPDNIFDRYMTPLWKRATIANMIEQGWNGQPCFLVDSASRKGMSGGPAIYYSRTGQIPTAGSYNISTPVAILHGVYVGRIGDGALEAQIGVVWKKEVIHQIIDDGIDAPLNAHIEAAPSEVDALIDAEWNAGSAEVIADEKPGLGYLISSLMEKIGGRTNPHALREALIRRAKKELGN